MAGPLYDKLGAKHTLAQPRVSWIAAAAFMGLLLLWAAQSSGRASVQAQFQALKDASQAAAAAAVTAAQAAASAASSAASASAQSSSPAAGAAMPAALADARAAWQSAVNRNLSEWRSSALERYGPNGWQCNFIDAFKTEWPKFAPFISCPPDRPLKRYGGDDDGSKLLCEVKPDASTGKGCVIYSMGSKGQYQFEEAMLNGTECDIHTFDCTWDGKSLHPRHTYHKWCIGNGEGRYRTWSNVTQTLGHSHVSLLKIDIEGHEYSVLGSFRPEHALPLEISLEVHANVPRMHAGPASTSSFGLFFLHLANLGYGEYAQEVNPLAPFCCSEFSFLRVNKDGVGTPV